MRLAYADPPYPGCSHLYPEKTEVDHAQLLARLGAYDGWVLHTSSPVSTLREILMLCPDDARVMAWVKPFAAFKRNVPVAYAWEPVIVKAARKPIVKPAGIVMRDWVAASITLQRGCAGAKPDVVCRWAFEVMGAEALSAVDEAHPGPWFAVPINEEPENPTKDFPCIPHPHWDLCYGDKENPGNVACILTDYNDEGVKGKADIDFIVGARTWVPELLDECERLRRLIEQAQNAGLWPTWIGTP